ncbi:hypothetical protein immuto35A_116 [Flavobacterium phage vB_FspM_immuto_3-5A]|uniref:Uncharacterized protein n=1 Tax=Flavobacterium phage vB_FspM_immuto_2-6A TaxID=2801477 RepID=A0A7T8ERE4_9CAUD|nr:hypothetical protein KNV73_gp154 [Flavobacterium phage vB_FspM_immuto_2-6A]QQO91796.1 hypothetical protein immuto26A_117 [Flavobacterium phage vB_FspM_immuto_2-6A]QQO92034.1 hypothetical protein immuto35A_116 [Flavobacterium phage vB_FspM_immuto_3-5A]QQO92272.1 hypothetical protein immuto136C_116 [Flavobacterium phage vB_FspM_immuto_13-6C]
MNNLKFKPTLTPIQMLRRGVFGGSYFGVEKLEGDTSYEVLFESFKDVDRELYLGVKYQTKKNKFKIKSGMPYVYWIKMNWMHKDDPYGWFEWYCKYYMGRRHEDDNRQIQRWMDFCGPNGRWRQRIYGMINSTGNWDISPRIQQSLLHWGYEVNENDFCTWREYNVYTEEEWCHYGGLPSPRAYE